MKLFSKLIDRLRSGSAKRREEQKFAERLAILGINPNDVVKRFTVRETFKVIAGDKRCHSEE